MTDPVVPLPEQHNENACTECGIDNPVWFAPSELWNLVMGGLDCTDDPGGFLCPVCFIRRAEAEGIVTTGWLLTTEEAAVAAEADNERLTAENANLRESAETAVFVANANTESLRIWQERYETLSLHHSAEAARADAAEARLAELKVERDHFMWGSHLWRERVVGPWGDWIDTGPGESYYDPAIPLVAASVVSETGETK